MLGLFATKKQSTNYDLARANQEKAKLAHSKIRLSSIAEQLRSGDSKNNLELAFELFDLMQYITDNTPSSDIDCGLVLSDSDTLRKNNKLGMNKYTIETTSGAWD